jgi:hypothetical protein
MVCDHTETAGLTPPRPRSSLWLTRFSTRTEGLDQDPDQIEAMTMGDRMAIMKAGVLQ